jgi:hypothetical protein
MPPSDTLMQSILDRLNALDERHISLTDMVHEIRENQIKIEGRLDSHIASSNSLSGVGTQTQNATIAVLAWAGKFIVPAVLSVFLAFSCTAPRADSKTKQDQPTIDTIYFDRTRASDLLKKHIEGNK